MSFGENAIVLGKNKVILPRNSPTISNNAGIFAGTATISHGNSPTLSVITLISPGDIAITWENTSIFSVSREKIKPIMNNNGGNMT
jgi:hypothetical protein